MQYQVLNIVKAKQEMKKYSFLGGLSLHLNHLIA